MNRLEELKEIYEMWGDRIITDDEALSIISNKGLLGTAIMLGLDAFFEKEKQSE